MGRCQRKEQKKKIHFKVFQQIKKNRLKKAIIGYQHTIEKRDLTEKDYRFLEDLFVWALLGDGL